MYTGSNPTALQSQKMIITALLELMEKKEFSRINIKELCEKALVSRQTFYTLFNNKEEAIGLHLDTLFNAFVKKYLQQKKEYTLKELCDNTIAYLVENKKLIRLMTNSRLDYLVKDKLEHHLLNLDNLLRSTTKNDQDYAIAFLAGGLMNVIVHAIKNDDFDDTEKISRLMENVISGEYLVS